MDHPKFDTLYGVCTYMLCIRFVLMIGSGRLCASCWGGKADGWLYVLGIPCMMWCMYVQIIAHMMVRYLIEIDGVFVGFFVLKLCPLAFDSQCFHQRSPFSLWTATATPHWWVINLCTQWCYPSSKLFVHYSLFMRCTWQIISAVLCMRRVCVWHRVATTSKIIHAICVRTAFVSLWAKA